MVACEEEYGSENHTFIIAQIDEEVAITQSSFSHPAPKVLLCEASTNAPANIKRKIISSTKDLKAEIACEDGEKAAGGQIFKRQDATSLSSSSASSTDVEEGESDDTSSSNVLEAALEAIRSDPGRKHRMPSSETNKVEIKSETIFPASKTSTSIATLTSPLISTQKENYKSTGFSSNLSKKVENGKCSLLWPALNEFYDFLLRMSANYDVRSENTNIHLSQYASGKLPSRYTSIEDYCNAQHGAILEEMAASVSTSMTAGVNESFYPIRHLSLASVTPCGEQGMSALSAGLTLGAIFTESGFCGNASGNEYILTFKNSAGSNFVIGDLVILRSPRWKHHQIRSFGVVLCDSVVAVGVSRGKSELSRESDQICVLIRVQRNGQNDGMESFNLLIKRCLLNQRGSNWRWSLQQVHNTTTSAREFQAIKAVSYLSNDLKQVLVSGNLSSVSNADEKNVAMASMLLPCMLKHLNEHYNYSQVRAILGCLGEDKRVIIQGPPGTGKSKTILGLLSALLDGAGISSLRKAKGTSRIRAGASLKKTPTVVSKSADETVIRVLVAAPSNAAVDELVLRVLSEGLYDGEKGSFYRPRIVRVGRPECSQQLSGLDAAREIGGSEKNRTKIKKYACGVEKVLLENLVSAHRSAFSTMKEARQAIIKNAQIVFCTLSGAGSVAMCEFKQNFDALIIDEAAQAVEASALIPFKFRPQRVVLVGDHRQLPATVISQKLVAMGYDRSLQQRLVENGSPVLLLTQQYRMHPEIAKFPSTYFYNGQLVQDEKVSEWTTQDYHADSTFKPLLFYDVQGVQSQVSGSTSLRNMSEVEAIIQIIRRLIIRFPCTDWNKRIGVIAPYKQQIVEVREEMKKLEAEFSCRLSVEVNTVDGFQGREKEIVIYSCVRTCHGGLRKKKRRRHGKEVKEALDAFWADERRMNVAITRAKSSLWVVGNSTLLKHSVAWQAFIQHAKDHKRYIKNSDHIPSAAAGS
ncbi:putative P-loop containing nucleoside triphosphate hydrolase, DNA2/NAM7 helicase, AAA [Plasmopara halstedii]